VSINEPCSSGVGEEMLIVEAAAVEVPAATWKGKRDRDIGDPDRSLNLRLDRGLEFLPPPPPLLLPWLLSHCSWFG
jgi:hypothetical protein